MIWPVRELIRKGYPQLKTVGSLLSDEKVGLAILDKRDMQYLYREGDGFVFMDTSTYDQVSVSEEVAGDAARYLSSA